MSADLLGACLPYEYQGQLYQSAPIDLFIERQFATWVAAEAALSLSRLKPRVPADFHAEQMRLYNAKVCGKQLDWTAPDVQQATMSDEGLRQLLWLKLARGQQKGGAVIEREDIDRIAGAKDKTKWRELVDIYYQQDFPADFFAQIQAERKASQRPPDSPAPATA